ncbi:hypothetical protein KP79_PYT09479 [Mizuhopecten yessoensis]|uniref:Uncharacterized protein n=1 Tax=Mizuhopecten yessoensis TaxID=6573 RepID=A0A210QNU3_MIZYE|nr:hypothetical protein KP79_PYT09479 [Mizuhopecten yessoensis]
MVNLLSLFKKTTPAPRTAPTPAPRRAPTPAPRTAPIPAPRTAPPPANRTPIPTSPSTPRGQFHVSFNVGDVPLEPVEVHHESDLDEGPAIDVSVVEDVAVTYQVVEGGTKRGGRKLVSSDGYSYTVKKTTRTSTAWPCSVRSVSLWCRASVLQHGEEFRFGQVAHVHAPDPGTLINAKVRAIVKEQARVHSYRSAGALTEDVMAEEVTPDDFNLPNPSHIQRAANRVREKLRPKEPIDLDFEIDTAFLGCEASWVTFASTGSATSSLEPHCSRSSYVGKEVFRHINEAIGTLNVRSIVMDFEAAVWSAVKVVYPEVDITGCYFHWAQAVIRKVQDLGLKTTYCEKKGLYVFVQQLLGLPYLPPGHIEKAFESLTAKLPNPAVEGLVSYLETAWLRNHSWSVRQWSVFRQSIPTNNDCEGWHRRFNGKAGRAMLHFYLLVPLLRKESNTVEVTRRLVEEQVLTRHRRARNSFREKKVDHQPSPYYKHTIRTSASPRAVSKLCAPGFPE